MIRKIIDDYIECNELEIIFKKNKLRINYYKNIENFSSNNIVITSDKKLINIKGKNLVIETMFKEYLIIAGEIISVNLEKENE